jgi:succinoglycan biosynthesis protein ExoA
VAVWVLSCTGYGLLVAVRQGRAGGILVGISAMIMHVAWSLGFWLQILAGGRGGKAA